VFGLTIFYLVLHNNGMAPIIFLTSQAKSINLYKNLSTEHVMSKY